LIHLVTGGILCYPETDLTDPAGIRKFRCVYNPPPLVRPGSFLIFLLFTIKTFRMRKITGLVWVLALSFAFASCSKEKVQPKVNNKSTNSAQSSGAQTQPEDPPASQPSSCPHSSGNPVNAG
jgi:hypothetical protein